MISTEYTRSISSEELEIGETTNSIVSNGEAGLIKSLPQILGGLRKEWNVQ